MDGKKKSTYTGLTEARKRANQKYIDKFVEVKVRMTADKRTIVQEHAASMNESTTAFINRAINEAMKRDADKKSSDAKNLPLLHHRIFMYKYTFSQYVSMSTKLSIPCKNFSFQTV